MGIWVGGLDGNTCDKGGGEVSRVDVGKAEEKVCCCRKQDSRAYSYNERAANHKVSSKKLPQYEFFWLVC